jgi:hypothetical protein
VDGKKKTSRVVYRDEAADLMEAAARNAAPAAQLDPPTIEVEARRVLPYPEPVGTNDNIDNIDAPRRPSTDLVPQRKRGSAMRTAAIVLLTPWYVVVTGASLGLIFLFVRGLVLP